MSGDLRAVHLFEDLPRVRTLHLQPISFARLRIDYTALVTFDLDVISARGCVKFNPVAGGGPADNNGLVVFQAKQDRVANDIAIVIHGDELLCDFAAEILECIDAKVREQAARIRSFHIEIGHVIGLIK